MVSIAPLLALQESSWTDRGGVAFTIRRIRASDAEALAAFHQGLSDRTVYLRYFEPLQLEQRVGHDRLQAICESDPDCDAVLVALSAERIAAVARLSIPETVDGHHKRRAAEFAVVVSDSFQKRGLGSELLRRLVDVADSAGIPGVTAFLMLENTAMRKMLERMGFTLRVDPRDQIVVGLRIKPGAIA